jgi:alanine racemase
VSLEGIFTHFADADSDGEDMTFTKQQLATFQEILDILTGCGLTPPLIHAANSAATLRLPKSHLTMVRPGMILYGPLPKGEYRVPFISKQILSLKTQIVQIRRIIKGESVGYGRAFVAKEDMVIATLPIGYADGFRRSPNFGEVLVKGKRAKLTGRVSMDQSSIDISHIRDVKVGDEVVIVGEQGDDEITMQEIADRIGTINYEVLTSLGERISRVYKE